MRLLWPPRAGEGGGFTAGMENLRWDGTHGSSVPRSPLRVLHLCRDVRGARSRMRSLIPEWVSSLTRRCVLLTFSVAGNATGCCLISGRLASALLRSVSQFLPTWELRPTSLTWKLGLLLFFKNYYCWQYYSCFPIPPSPPYSPPPRPYPTPSLYHTIVCVYWLCSL